MDEVVFLIEDNAGTLQVDEDLSTLTSDYVYIETFKVNEITYCLYRPKAVKLSRLSSESWMKKLRRILVLS